MSSSQPQVAASTGLLPDGTTVGYAQLTVRDLDRQRWFYETLLGLRYELLPDGRAAFWPPEATVPTVVLHEDKSATPKPEGSTGLFHIALRVPTRPSLGRWLKILHESRYPLSGASDHIVSEALYLDDPEGNGIELYWDRPATTWTWDKNSVKMASLPLDLQAIYNQAEADDIGLQVGTCVGHMHLQVRHLARAEAFYGGQLGLGVTARGYPGALFMAAGKYHHHLGLNTWGTTGASAAPAGSLGLTEYSLHLPDATTWQNTVANLKQSGCDVQPITSPLGASQAVRVTDSDGIAVVVAS